MIFRTTCIVLATITLAACSTSDDVGDLSDEALTLGNVADVADVVYAVPRPAEFGKTGQLRNWEPQWNGFIVNAIDTYSQNLVGGPNEPVRSLEELCPKYASATHGQKKAIWALVFAEIARYESAFKTDDRYGEPGQCIASLPASVSCKDELARHKAAGTVSPHQNFSEGLLSMSMGDGDGADGIGCKQVRDRVGILDPEKNLTCGVAVMGKKVRNKGKAFVLLPALVNGKPPAGAYWSVLSTKADKIRANFAADSTLLRGCR